jgi:hypothetical protein
MRTFLDIYEGWDRNNTEFVDDLEEGLLVAQEADSAEMLKCLSYESRMLIDTFYTSEPVLEAGNVDIGVNSVPTVKKNVSGFAARMTEFFKNIIDFITNTISKFMDSVKNIFTSNQQFIKDNYAVLTNIPAGVALSLSITVVPYDDLGATRRLTEPNGPETRDIFAFFDNIIAGKVSNLNIKEITGGGQQILQSFFPNLYKLDSRDAKHAALLYYCGGKEPATVQYNTTDAVKHIKMMADFLRDYKNTSGICQRYADMIKNKLADLNKKLNNYQKEANRLMQVRSQAAANFKQQRNNIRNPQNNNQNQGANAAGGAQVGTGNAAKEAMLPLLYFYGPDMYSALEGTDIRKTEFGYAFEAISPGTVAGATNTNAGATTPPPRTPEQQQAMKDVQQNVSQTNAETKAKVAQNKDAQAVLQFGINLAKIYATIIGCRMTVCQQIATHYRKVLDQVVAGINQYNQNREKNNENIAYNNQQEMNKRQAQADYIQAKQDEAERNRADYKAKNVNRGKIRGAWAKLFGNGQ